jgi:nucleoside-diphosphate-sugar epimerase
MFDARGAVARNAMSELPKCFITGATGFIGSWLVRKLAERGHVVHALTRRGKPEPPPGFAPGEGPNWDHPNVRLVDGDVTDRESLRRGMAGCSQVYHLAGYAKNWARDPKTYIDVNVGGLCNVCDIALELKAERVAWTSTLLTFGPTKPGETGDETTTRTTSVALTDYERSKTAAELESLKYVDRSLPVVTVNLCRVFGPGYLNEANSTPLVIDMYDRGKMPVLMGGHKVGNWVYVHDVVDGLIGAMQFGRAGEKYLLGGENLSLKQLLQIVDRVTGRRHFQITIRRPAAMIYAGFQQLRANWFGVYPQITPAWVQVFLADWAYSSAKAERELGYQITPIEDAVRKTYEWLLRVRAAKERG